jgi:hypothetical protein
LEDIEMAAKYNIHLVALIKNSTAETQPLDKVHFGPWKRDLEIEKNALIYKNGASGQLYKLQKRDIVKCGTASFNKIDTPANRTAAFIHTGLWPFNAHIFDDKFKALRAHSSALPASSPPVLALPESSHDLAGYFLFIFVSFHAKST